MGRSFIRNLVYETNSSSSHSLSLAENESLDRYFDDYSIRSGVVNIKMDERGDYQHDFRYYRPENILGFLIAGEIEANAYATSQPDWQANGLSGYGDFMIALKDIDLLPTLRKYYSSIEIGISFLEHFTKLKFTLVIKAGRPFIVRTGNLEHITGYLSDQSNLKRLLFNSKSYVETTSENGWSYMPIDSDVGRVWS